MENMNQNTPPAGQLNTKRTLVKYILLGLVTFGIYPIVFWSGISQDINTIASRYDGKKTMHFCLVFFLLTGLTAGIYTLVWYHQLSNRMGAEAKRRGLNCELSAKDFWLWNILGSFIIVGPFVYANKVAKCSNLLAEDYNARGC